MLCEIIFCLLPGPVYLTRTQEEWWKVLSSEWDKVKHFVGRKDLADLTRDPVELAVTNYHLEQLQCSNMPDMNATGLAYWRELVKNSVFKPETQPLVDFKNPCWNITVNTTSDLKSLKQKHTTLAGEPQFEAISCFPYVYIAGMPKSATTDIYRSLMLHPNIIASRKEPEWWTKKLLGEPNNRIADWREYAGVYAEQSKFIQSVLRMQDMFHPGIVVDGSPSTFWEMNRWPLYPGNEHVMAPEVTTAHLIHNVTPDARIVVMLRNPVNRLYSHYFHRCYLVNSNCDPAGFHQAVVESLEEFHRCMSSRRLRECVYDTCINELGVMGRVLAVRGGLYYVYVQDWLKVFPRHQLYFVHYETYVKRRADVVDDIIHFIGLDSIPAKMRDRLSSNHKENRRKAPFRRSGNMFPSTQKLLRDFYKPYNQNLADLLLDSRFLW